MSYDDQTRRDVYCEILLTYYSAARLTSARQVKSIAADTSTTPPEGHAPRWSLAHASTATDDHNKTTTELDTRQWFGGDRCAEDQWIACTMYACACACACASECSYRRLHCYTVGMGVAKRNVPADRQRYKDRLIEYITVNLHGPKFTPKLVRKTIPN
ncbi:hypothetical protein QTP88_005414 [Uroleucon formosanum]